MSTSPDDARERFAQEMGRILNYGALNLAMGIGYRTGLFEALDSLDAPATAQRIAERAGLDERYVREWLGVMATGGVVAVPPDDGGGERFFLPTPHGDVLCRRAGSANLGVYTQEIPLLAASVLDAVASGFETGKGVDYDHYPRFQAFMSELADAKHRQVLVDTFLPSVDGGRMTAQLDAGIRVCDLGCGQGVALNLMARAFPSSRFTGLDIDARALAIGRGEARRLGLDNAVFAPVDAARLPGDRSWQDRFDYVTAFDAIHDQTRPLQALRGVVWTLAPGGLFSMVDIAARTHIADNLDHPMGPFLYTVSLMHCMPVGRVDGGTGLGMMWGREQAADLLRQAGFGQVALRDIPDDPFNLHYECRV